MKKILLILFIASSCFFSCDKIEEANTIDFDATVNMNIPVVVAEPSASATKSAQADYSFYQTQTEKLENIKEIKNYIKKLKSISVERINIEFTNLAAGEEIKTISFSVKNVGVIATYNNITSSNNKKDIDNHKLKQAAETLMNTKEITVSVSGKANKPMDFNTKLKFNCSIEASAIK